MTGRGRGESSRLTELDELEREPRRPRIVPAGPLPPLIRESSSSGDSSSDSGDKIVRGRGGYRQLNTIPQGITELQAQKGPLEQGITVCTNFVAITPMEDRPVYQYRVDFEPEIESVSMRRSLFRELVSDRMDNKYTYDGMHDLLSGFKFNDETSLFSIPDPRNVSKQVILTVKRVGLASSAFELVRIYNMNMKAFLRALGYFSVSQAGAYVHPALSTQIGQNTNIAVLRGFRTSANVHEDDKLLMNLESVHKIMQQRNVLQVMMQHKGNPNVKEILKSQLTGKLVVTNYNKIVYKIEDVDFTVSPRSTFHDERNNIDVSYMDYYQNKYNLRIADNNQPLLLVVPNNTRQRGDEEQRQRNIYLIPELCNIAGLTDEQRNDNRLKVDLIKSSQIPPADRVAHLRTFLNQLHSNAEVNAMLNKWGYTYDREPLKIKARILKLEQIGVGNTAMEGPDKWPRVDHMASFEPLVMREKLAVQPVQLKRIAVLITRVDAQNEDAINSRLRQGFNKVGLKPDRVDVVRIREGDSAHHYVQYLRELPDDTQAAIVILNRQNKDRYDAVKKLATVDRGLITQVVTARLMMDERKASGAAVKIAIQIAAKLGGEPWHVYIPLSGTMICGYDTYHDTANRGRSYGAFMASMNRKFSQWYSKVDSHDRLDELSSHLAENVGKSMQKFKELSGKFPERIFIYRDGVSDGQLPHVYEVELKYIKKVIKSVNPDSALSFIVVNKRIGARFYMCNNGTFINPPPGSVIDSVVTRKERYDFYLISQSTRNGTVTPTYYNILHDDCKLGAARQQQLAYKLCFLYYNWTGTVRVPAPCQYAHKLALLCGEHLHNVPNTKLENRLHFL